ncbi:MAG TPA: 6,7-dimethyl-8-ribityllumazine synthase [Pyrinomonadaceae bacterium]|jgi:6,7-dimethyl-8-ribityllumazine synthase|nr:6,7-dimethyl-8-ribityllumazine synthase [Pyrinomonadaceae bacterium]
MQTQIDFAGFSAEDFRFAIVVARWNGELTSKLADGAVEALTKAGVPKNAIEIFRVPGAFELPLASMKAAETGLFDAVIALGVVIRGETPHFDFVAGRAAAGIMQASLDTGVPVMFGVVTADTREQAEARCGGTVGNKGYESAMSAIEMASLAREIEGLDQGEDKFFPHVV